MGVKLDRSRFMGTVFVRLKQLGVVFNSYSKSLRLRLRGQ